MPVDRDIAPVYGANRGNKRGTVKVWTPILVQNGGFLIDQEFDALPNGHSIFAVLTQNIPIGCG